jgi:threonine aldolase
MIDLRSDTQTKPSAAMRAAMATAEVGDEQAREDPTVLELERRGAELLGQEEAVYLPTATMANQIALLILGERGTELVVEETAHIMVSELGGAAMHGGLQTRGLAGTHGRLSSEQIRATMHEDGSFHTPRTSVVALENTHNNAGGTVWPVKELFQVVATRASSPEAAPRRGTPANASVHRRAGERARRTVDTVSQLLEGAGRPPALIAVRPN